MKKFSVPRMRTSYQGQTTSFASVMANEEFVVDSTLCFVNSARSDYSYESLFDVAYAFYSHEEIKRAKEKICILLKKDIVWRRDPEKKKKDLKDLLDYHEEFKSSNRHVKFVTMSHKKMPPVGLEIFAPILTNLAEDIMKLNEVIPKILDIKSEVSNTADTVRQMQMDVQDLKKKFTSAVTGMEGAAKDLRENEIEVLDQIHSFRQSIGSARATEDPTDLETRMDEYNSILGDGMDDFLNIGKSYAEVITKQRDLSKITSPKTTEGDEFRLPTPLHSRLGNRSHTAPVTKALCN